MYYRIQHRGILIITVREYQHDQSIFYFSQHHPTQTEAQEDRFPGVSRLSYEPVNIAWHLAMECLHTQAMNGIYSCSAVASVALGDTETS